MGEPIPPILPWCDHHFADFEMQCVVFDLYELDWCDFGDTWSEWLGNCDAFWFTDAFSAFCEPDIQVYMLTGVTFCGVAGPGDLYMLGNFTYVGQVSGAGMTPWPSWLCHDPGYLLPVDTAKSEEGICANGDRWTRVADWKTSTNILIRTAQLP